jgi:hypothetical protein
MQIVDRGLFCERKGRENPGASAQICISFPFRIYFSFKYCRELNKCITWKIIIQKLVKPILPDFVKYKLSGKNDKPYSSCNIF